MAEVGEPGWRPERPDLGLAVAAATAGVDQHASFAVLSRTAASAKTCRLHSAKPSDSNAAHIAHSASHRLILELPFVHRDRCAQGSGWDWDIGVRQLPGASMRIADVGAPFLQIVCRKD